jgi:hypothetical protein
MSIFRKCITAWQCKVVSALFAMKFMIINELKLTVKKKPVSIVQCTTVFFGFVNKVLSI